MKELLLMTPAVLLLGVAWCPAGLAQAEQHLSEADIERGMQKMESAFSAKGLRLSPEIPTNFPVPVYPSNVITKNFTTTTRAPIVATALMVTKDQPKTAYQWYLSYCTRDSWTIRTHKPNVMSKMEKDGNMYMFNAEKSDKQLNFYCMRTPKGTGTTINISFFLKSKPL